MFILPYRSTSSAQGSKLVKKLTVTVTGWCFKKPSSKMMEFINGKDYRMTSLFYEMENKNQMVETTNQVTGWWFKSSLACGKFKSTSQP